MSKERKLGSQPEGTAPPSTAATVGSGSQDPADLAAQVGGPSIPFALPAKFPP